MKMNLLGNGYISVTEHEYLTTYLPKDEYELINADDSVDVILRRKL